ncbi:MAG: succinate dehydrogenase cytochrome b subunit [Opitutales bacterium]
MSTLVKKYLMALTGLVLVGFVIGHMTGNLQMFLHPDWINAYAYKLQHLPYGLLWVVRAFLLLAVVVHIVVAVLLVIENRKARPQGYSIHQPLTSSFAARTMRYSGLILAAFIVFHILHFTVKSVHPEMKDWETRLEGTAGAHGMESRTLWGVYDKLTNQGANPEAASNQVHDVYRMVAVGFSPQYWYVSLFYLVSMGLLCAHLSHGVSSMFQSLGLRNAIWRARLGTAATVIAVVVFLGFAALPAAGLLGAFDGHLETATTAATLSH